MKISAIILAAGRSSRFGKPKVLHDFNGKPFLRCICENLQSAGIRDIVLVLGYKAQTYLPLLPEQNLFQVVINEYFDYGQFSSLCKGLQAVPKTSKGVIMCLIDQPHIKAETYSAILNAGLKNKDKFIIPRFRGRGGHPLFIPAAYFEKILSYSPRHSLRDVLRDYPNNIKHYEVADEGILEDIDTAEDLNRLQNKYS